MTPQSSSEYWTDIYEDLFLLFSDKKLGFVLTEKLWKQTCFKLFELWNTNTALNIHFNYREVRFVGRYNNEQYFIIKQEEEEILQIQQSPKSQKDIEILHIQQLLQNQKELKELNKQKQILQLNEHKLKFKNVIKFASIDNPVASPDFKITKI